MHIPPPPLDPTSDPEDPTDLPMPEFREPWNRRRELFTIRIDLDGEKHSIGYDSLDSALYDPGLAALMENGAVTSVWLGGLRVTRDISHWQTLRDQLVINASTLLRRAL